MLSNPIDTTICDQHQIVLSGQITNLVDLAICRVVETHYALPAGFVLGRVGASRIIQMNGQYKSLFWPTSGCWVLLALVLPVLAGCQTASIDNLGVGEPQHLTKTTPADTNSQALPQTQTNPPTAEAVAETVPTTAAKSEIYPVIGYARTGETRQLTKPETDAIREQLRAASDKASQRGGGEDSTSYEKQLEELRKKAKTHGQEALKKIEKPAE